MQNKKEWITSIILIIIIILPYIVIGIKNDELKEVKNKIHIVQEEYKVEILNNDMLTQDLNDAIATISTLKNEEYKFVYLGNFKITHYCTEKYEHICGNGDNRTATGTTVTPGTTIAVDPSVIPYGSKVYIDGYGWRSAQDCGGAVQGEHIDMAVSSHGEAMNLGVRNKGVWLLVKNS